MQLGDLWRFDWWSALRTLIRYGVSLGLLAIAVLLFVYGYWRSGASVWGAALVLFLLAGRSDSEKKGYWW